MDKRELIATLHKLHEELDRHPQLDDPAKESLRQLADEIHELLGTGEPVQAVEDYRCKRSLPNGRVAWRMTIPI